MQHGKPLPPYHARKERKLPPPAVNAAGGEVSVDCGAPAAVLRMVGHGGGGERGVFFVALSRIGAGLAVLRRVFSV